MDDITVTFTKEDIETIKRNILLADRGRDNGYLNLGFILKAKIEKLVK